MLYHIKNKVNITYTLLKTTMVSLKEEGSESKEALKLGNFCNALTHALIKNASMVTFNPDFSFSLFNETRKASKSVMSASS